MITWGFIHRETTGLKASSFLDPWTRMPAQPETPAQLCKHKESFWNRPFPYHTLELKSSGSRFEMQISIIFCAEKMLSCARWGCSMMWEREYSTWFCRRKVCNQVIENYGIYLSITLICSFVFKQYLPLMRQCAEFCGKRSWNMLPRAWPWDVCLVLNIFLIAEAGKTLGYYNEDVFHFRWQVMFLSRVVQG